MTFDLGSASPESTSTPSSTPASTPAPAPSASPAPSQDPAPSSAAASAANPGQGASDPANPGPGATPAEVAAYKANLKFKVLNEEKEIDPLFHGIIKDAETEKKIREMHEKAFGLDIVKPRLKDLQDKYKQVNEQHTQVLAGIDELRTHVGRGDFDAFFQRLRIDPQKVLQWVVNKAQYEQMPPEERAVLDARKAAEQRAYQAETQVETLQRQHEEQLSRTTQMLLESTLERGDVRSASSVYDAKVGKPGAFKQLVAERGHMAWQRGEYLPPEKAVQEVMSMLGPFLQGAQAPAGAAASAAPQGPATPPAKEPPVIPNLGGRPSSPTGTVPKSIDDLRKIRAQMAGS